MPGRFTCFLQDTCGLLLAYVLCTWRCSVPVCMWASIVMDPAQAAIIGVVGFNNRLYCASFTAFLLYRYGARISRDAVKSLRLCLQQIWQREGIKGFYKGSLPSIIKAAPSAAVTFATYEFVIGYAATTMRT